MVDHVAKDSTGDGNCIFNTVSYLLIGNEKLSTELRVRTVIELALYRTWYENQHQQFENIADYIDSFLDSAVNGGYSSIWTLWALATVIQRVIVSVCPILSEQNDLATLAAQCLNTTLNPRFVGQEFPQLSVLWTRCHNVDNVSDWGWRHVVPLVPLHQNVSQPSALVQESLNNSYVSLHCVDNYALNDQD